MMWLWEIEDRNPSNSYAEVYAVGKNLDRRFVWTPEAESFIGISTSAISKRVGWR